MTQTLKSQFVYLEVQNGVGTVTINNPPVNALSSQVLRELEMVFQAVQENPHIRAVVLTGDGEKVFVAGADIKALQSLSPKQAEELALQGQHTFQRLEEMEKITLCAINGLALGGGLELAMACDFRICSSTAQMGQPEINLGIIPGFGGTQRLPRLIGMARAKQMLLTGTSIDAQKAYDYGLVNLVTSPETVLSVALEIAHTIASKSLSALHSMHTCVNKGWQMPFHEALQLEATSFGVIFGTEDKTEGIQAFLEKRSPQFKGH